VCVCFSLKRKTVRPEERRIEILPFKLQSQGQEVKPAASWNTHTHTHTHTLSLYCLFKARSLTLILNIWSFTKLQSHNPASVFIFLCACACMCVSLKSLSVFSSNTRPALLVAYTSITCILLFTQECHYNKVKRAVWYIVPLIMVL